MVNAAITARPASSQYIHGTDANEQRRLSALNDHLNETSLAALAPRHGDYVLDVGCGLAQLSRAIARRVGRAGKVIGIERSAEQIAEGARQAEMSGESHLVEVRQGDALAMPLAEQEWGSFDVAHTRYLLEHVSDPQAVVDAMVRAVRPGGRIVLEDDDHDVLRLWPEPAGFTALMHAYARTYDRLGNDPYIGRRLVSLLHNAGATPRRNNWLFFGTCAGDPAFHAWVDNVLGIFSGARESVVSAGLLDASSFDEAVAALNAWRTRPDAAAWYAVAWAEAIRR